MSRALLVLVAAALVSSGCSSAIAFSGTDVSNISSRSEAHRQFGTPAKVVTAGGDEVEDYEIYHTHVKVSEPQRGTEYLLGDLLTTGLAELILFPYEMVMVGHTTFAGEDIRFNYDPNGNVTGIIVNGEAIASRTNSGRTIEGIIDGKPPAKDAGR
jgi:YD repeat-containing protein